MWAETASQALREGKCLQISYDNWTRIVEVHAVGYSSDGNGLMRVWQVRGGSNSGETQGWKLLRLDETWNYGVTNESSQAPRRGYARGDKAMARIICQL